MCVHRARFYDVKSNNSGRFWHTVNNLDNSRAHEINSHITEEAWLKSCRSILIKKPTKLFKTLKFPSKVCKPRITQPRRSIFHVQ